MSFSQWESQISRNFDDVSHSRGDHAFAEVVQSGWAQNATPTHETASQHLPGLSLHRHHNGESHSPFHTETGHTALDTQNRTGPETTHTAQSSGSRQDFPSDEHRESQFGLLQRVDGDLNKLSIDMSHALNLLDTKMGSVGQTGGLEVPPSPVLGDAVVPQTVTPEALPPTPSIAPPVSEVAITQPAGADAPPTVPAISTPAISTPEIEAPPPQAIPTAAIDASPPQAIPTAAIDASPPQAIPTAAIDASPPQAIPTPAVEASPPAAAAPQTAQVTDASSLAPPALTSSPPADIITIPSGTTSVVPASRPDAGTGSPAIVMPATSDTTGAPNSNLSTSMRVAAYTGAGVYGEATSLTQQLGKTVVPSDYFDLTQTEAQTVPWVISQYEPWQQANPGTPMILGTPLTFAGQTIQQTASGANNAEFVDMAQQLVNAGMGNSVIRLGWEGNGNWYPWGADPTDYVAAYNQAAQAMKSVPGANFSFDWSVSAGETNNTPFSQYYPGNQNVNSIGIDAYDWDFANPNASPQERWNTILNEPGGLQDVANFASQQGKPFSVPEWGLVQSESAGGTSPGGGDDPYYINQMAAFMNNNNTAFQSYFDTAGGGVGTTLEQNPQSDAAYIADFASTST
jgi:hypothetical protein